MSEKTIIQRLIQRKLIPWAVAYLAGAFVAYQGVQVVGDTMGLSPIVFRTIHILLILGFLLTAVLAWYHGAPGPQRVSGKELLTLAAVLAAGGTALIFLRRTEGESSLPPGFRITTESGSESGGSSSGRSVLGDLIASTLSDDGDQFESSIAILPLENRGGDPALDTLAGGMTAELIARLSRIRGLKVISRQSMQELEGLNLDAAQIGDTLHVDHLLVGRTFAGEEAPWVEVRLVLVEGEETLWRSEYPLEETTRDQALEEIFNEVGSALLQEVPTLSIITPNRATESPGYAAYLAGGRELNKRTQDGVLRAIDAFRNAISRDSSFAPAYAGLSSAYALSVTYRYDIGVDGYAAAGLALRAADAAVELDDQMAEAYAARGYVSSISLAPAQSVGADFARAMELQPNAPNVAAWYANLLIREGYYDQAMAEAQRAVDLDPLSSPRRTGLAYEALRARDYGLAIDQARVAQSLEAEIMLPRSIHAQALLLSGRAEECIEMSLGPHAGIRALCLHAVGRREEARQIVDSLRTAVQAGGSIAEDFTSVIQAGDLAAYYAWTGDPERALPWIHRVYALSPSGIDVRVLDSGLFDRLMENRVLRREVEGIRDRIWNRVQREKAQAVIGVGGRDQ